jgi:hypothetical protein
VDQKGRDAAGVEAGRRPGFSSTFSLANTGSTGTLGWADPASETTCVVLTSLPVRAMDPHPLDLAAGRVAAAARR